MMSRCFNWFPFWSIRRTQFIPRFVGYYKKWGFYLERFSSFRKFSVSTNL